MEGKLPQIAGPYGPYSSYEELQSSLFTNPTPRSDGKIYHWSPDGGKYVEYDGKFYWHDGSVTTDPIFRKGLQHVDHGEDYSAWTEEHRAKVRAESQARYKQAKEREEQERARREELVKQAEAKLTEEEISAMAEFYRY